MAAQIGAELTVAHVFTIDPANLPGGYVVLPVEELEKLKSEAQGHLDCDWIAEARNICREIRTVLLDGNAAGALIEFARKENIDMIVVGNRGRGGFTELLLGSVGHHLTQHAQLPVTIVPSR